MNDIIFEIQDLRHLNWARTRGSSGTAGSFLKSYDDTGKTKKYYKLSDYEPLKGITGHECVNEIVAQRLLRILGTEHLEYKLVHALITVEGRELETYLCESEDYKKRTESKMAFEDYYAIEKEEGESPLDLCVRKGWELYIYEMFLIDYLILNRDRHGANIEVLRDRKSKTDRLAPLFDHGLSLICRCRTKEEAESFDVMEDRRVQSFAGTTSTLANIKTVPRSFLTEKGELREQDIDGIFEGLGGIISPEHILKMREMIEKRWKSLDHI